MTDCLDPFAFIPTSEVDTEKKKHLKFGWVFDLAAIFSTDIANAMKAQLKEKFKTWSDAVEGGSVGKPFCSQKDCSDLVIDVSDYNKDYRLKFDIDAVP